MIRFARVTLLCGVLLVPAIGAAVIFQSPARAQDVPATPAAPDAEAAPPPPKHALDAATDDDKKLYEAVKARMLKLGPEQVTSIIMFRGFGEKVGSHIAPMLETMLWGYRYSGDTAWLDRFTALMTALEKALGEDPDGRPGWYSNADTRRISDPWPPTWPDDKLLVAWQQSEARIGAVCADLAITIRDEPELRDKFGAAADRWVELFETRLLPKWEKDCYQDLGQDRAIFTWPDRCFKKGEAGWQPYPGSPRPDQNVTLPHPAISEIVREYLKLWQLKGDENYRTRAARLLRWQKSCLRPGKNESYWWNFWDPAGDHDFLTEGGLAFGMFLSLEQLHAARDVEAFVEAYHSGVVIDKDDLRRLANTQLKVMLTGDPESPTWMNAKGQGRGSYWPQLAEFDADLAALLPKFLDARSNDFGGALRFLQEKPRWADGARRLLGDAKPILWDKTFNDFKKEMDELIKSHPPPDPRDRQRLRRGSGGARPGG